MLECCYVVYVRTYFHLHIYEKLSNCSQTIHLYHSFVGCLPQTSCSENMDVARLFIFKWLIHFRLRSAVSITVESQRFSIQYISCDVKRTTYLSVRIVSLLFNSCSVARFDIWYNECFKNTIVKIFQVWSPDVVCTSSHNRSRWERDNASKQIFDAFAVKGCENASADFGMSLLFVCNKPGTANRFFIVGIFEFYL
jgi:hypothetical protein